MKWDCVFLYLNDQRRHVISCYFVSPPHLVEADYTRLTKNLTSLRVHPDKGGDCKCDDKL